MQNLTIEKAFQTMVAFLENYYSLTKADDVGALLGDLAILSDGTTADPGAWHDWLKAVERALNSSDDEWKMKLKK